MNKYRISLFRKPSWPYTEIKWTPELGLVSRLVLWESVGKKAAEWNPLIKAIRADRFVTE